MNAVNGDHRPWSTACRRTTPRVVSLIAAVAIVVDCAECVDVIVTPGGYPFGSDFFPSISPYHSRWAYIAYLIAHITCPPLMIHGQRAAKPRLFIAMPLASVTLTVLAASVNG